MQQFFFCGVFTFAREKNLCAPKIHTRAAQGTPNFQLHHPTRNNIKLLVVMIYILFNSSLISHLNGVAATVASQKNRSSIVCVLTHTSNSLMDAMN
jgi:hypothetical protein